MYPQKETDQSFEYLKKVVAILDEPICLIGGWAIYFTVNKNYQASVGRKYIGSKDIDLGFHIDEKQEFANSAFAKAIKKLEEEGFTEAGGRMVKDLDYDTGKEIKPEDAKTKPIYELHKMYVDLMADQIPKTNPWGKSGLIFDEELLDYVFDDERHRIELEQFKRKLWMPQPWLLLAMKIKALPNRQKDHKRQKDIADISVILTFTNQLTYGPNLTQVLSRDKILESLNSITEEEVKETEKLLGLQTNTFRAPLNNLIRQIETNDFVFIEEIEEWQNEITKAIEKRNTNKLQTILETVADKSQAIPLFYNKNFRKTIFRMLDQKNFMKGRVTDALIKIIYDQRNFRKNKQEITEYSEQLFDWIKPEGINTQFEARGLELLLVGGNLKGFSEIVKTRNGNRISDVLNAFDIRNVKNQIDKKTLKDLKEWVSKELDNETNDNYTDRFHKLYKILK